MPVVAVPFRQFTDAERAVMAARQAEYLSYKHNPFNRLCRDMGYKPERIRDLLVGSEGVCTPQQALAGYVYEADNVAALIDAWDGEI